MQTVILAGGLGTRLSEETYLKPKPMVEIGGKPILWHILKIYSYYGLNDFIICCGYKGYIIKEYFANYFLHMSDVTFKLGEGNNMEIHQNKSESWKVTCVDTGDLTMTGGRLARIKGYLKDTFCLTYGDGVSDVNISDLINFHKNNKRLATLTAVKPPGRFGALNIKSNFVNNFQEKPQGDGSWINGGFFVLEPEVLNYIDGDDCVWEELPLRNLANKNELAAFKHSGFWRPMDTLRDKRNLEELWENNKAPWRIW